MFVLRHRCIVLTVLAGVVPLPAAAQQVGSADAGASAAIADIVPAPPELPEVMARDELGRATVRAVRVPRPPAIDGVLDDELYRLVAPIDGLLQQEPDEGAPSSEDAQIWVTFDDRHVYVSARLWQDPAGIVATEMRRDNFNLTRNDNFGVILDTFRDRRSGYFFYASAAGGVFDGHVTDESQNTREWNTVWHCRTGRFEGGWTVEMAIPFRSLRYAPGRDQVWGLNFRRIILAKNELATLTRIPASYGNPGVMRVSLAASLVGLQAPAGGKGLEIKPYAITGLTTDRTATPARSNDLSGDVGVDLKYGVTRGLTADFTYNTDFAQVEDDELQVNLTRFSLFFPERREFFLEGQGIFSFGGVRTAGGRGGGGGGGGGGGNNALTPILFFSRQIGLSGSRPVPINAGGRLTGRAGRYSIGAVNIQTGDDPRIDAVGTNFSVLRIRRDILQRSSIGILATNRSVALDGGGSNQAVGVDALLPLHRELVINSYYAATFTPDRPGGTASYRAQLDYPADRYGLQLEHLAVGRNFNPEVGFLRRRDFRRNFAQLRFSPRPRTIDAIRKLTWQASLDYITDTRGRLETREVQAMFRSEFENNDQATVEYTRSYEFLPEEFEIADDVVLPVGGYSFAEVAARYELGPQRPVSGNLTFSRGGFFSGDRTSAGYSGRLELTPALTLEPSVSVNWVNLVEGRFVTKLVSTRTNVSFTPRMLLGALVQYNSSSSTVALNVRYHWEYQPGSDLYVVYSEGRDTLGPGLARLQNRSVAVKLTRLLRF